MRTQIASLGARERELLLHCARVQMDEDRVSAITGLMDGPLDWSAITFYARLHSVAPLVHHHLSRIAGETVPRDARRQLLALHQRAAYQNRLYVREQGELLDAFRDRDCPVIVQKGLVLLEDVYGSLARRPLIDLIFLLRPESIDVARQVLVGRGYREERVPPLPALFRWSFEQPIFKKRGGELDLAVVIQASLVTWPRLHRLTIESLWANARTGSTFGKEVLLLSPVDLLLYLCVQADNHGYLNRAALGSVEPSEVVFGTWSNNRLVRFVDIHEVVRHYREEIDWDVFVERARSTMLEDAARASLTLTNEVLGTTAPESVLAALRTPSRPLLRGFLLDAAVRSNGASEMPTGSAWGRLPARHQIQLAQLLGLVEYTFPRPQTLRRLDGGGNLPLAATYALHAGRTIARSTLSFLMASLPRATQ